MIKPSYIHRKQKRWWSNYLCLSLQTIEEELGSEFAEEMPKEPYFVDFLREAPEVTGQSESNNYILTFFLPFSTFARFVKGDLCMLATG